MSTQHFVAIYSVDVQIFQSGAKWWTNQPTLPSLKELSHSGQKESAEMNVIWQNIVPEMAASIGSTLNLYFQII